LSLGSHPDIVERVWDSLSSALSGKSRCIVYGTPALIAPGSGVILALALGTSYALRVTPDAYAEALRRGAETSHAYRTDGVMLDLAKVFGPGWIFGSWRNEEPQECAAAAEFHDRAAAEEHRRKPNTS